MKPKMTLDEKPPAIIITQPQADTVSYFMVVITTFLKLSLYYCNSVSLESIRISILSRATCSNEDNTISALNLVL